MKTSNQPYLAGALAMTFLAPAGAFAEASTEELAQASQNPVANMISVPVQANVNFGVGNNDTSFTNLVQPVIPMALNDDWNLINRAIIPVPIYQPGTNSEWGLGDIQYQGFISPSKPGSLIWGAGPVISFPTASDDILGSQKWSAGPGVVLLKIKGPWVFGCLASHVWSFAGDDNREDVSLSTFQYFINYNIPNCNGWYLTSSPTNTYNWSADSDQAWTVPVGAGVGRVFKIGDQALNAKLQGFTYPIKPDNGPEWSIQFQLTFMFPNG